MCFFRYWIFLNVLLHALHVCTAVSLFMMMCLAKQFHFILIYINFFLPLQLSILSNYLSLFFLVSPLHLPSICLFADLDPPWLNWP